MRTIQPIVTSFDSSVKKTCNPMLFLYAMVFILCFFCCQSAHADDELNVTLYGARLSADSLGDTLTFKATYENSYLAVLAVSKKVHSYQRYAAIELEAQVAKHFGAQDHWEFNVLPVIRWLSFPWDKYLDTSFATGVGMSYAFETPKIEAVGVPSTPNLLGYLMIEFVFSPPDSSKWGFVTRVHHRSGANGFFGGRLDASNAIGFGIKYSF